MLAYPRGVIREATVHDIPDILRLVRELAAYEREPDAVEATEEMYASALFPERGEPSARVLIASDGDRPVGMALWFPTFSTWTGREGIWLEDLYVEPAHRGAGHGLALLRRLAQLCRERGGKRLDWSVLTWNRTALDFYETLGAVRKSDWVQCRVDGAALTALAQGGR